MASEFLYDPNPICYYESMKKCIQCKRIKPESQFNFKNKQTGRLNARCKECTRKDIMAAYYKNRAYYLTYRAARNKQLHQEIAQHLYNYLLDHPCVDCGFSDPRALQFDHVRGEKFDAVSMMVRRGFSLRMIITEVEKCDIRCANCHAIKTAVEQGYYRNIKV